MAGVSDNAGLSSRNQALEQDPALREIVARLARVYEPLKIYLFGSRARGTENSESDYDLLVVVRDDAPDERRTSGLAHRALWGVRQPTDVLVCTDEWLRTRQRVMTSVAAKVMREGKLLYAA